MTQSDDWMSVTPCGRAVHAQCFVPASADRDASETPTCAVCLDEFCEGSEVGQTLSCCRYLYLTGLSQMSLQHGSCRDQLGSHPKLLCVSRESLRSPHDALPPCHTSDQFFESADAVIIVYRTSQP